MSPHLPPKSPCRKAQSTKSLFPWLWPNVSYLRPCKCADSWALAEWRLDGQHHHSAVWIFSLTSCFKLIEAMKYSTGHVTETTAWTEKKKKKGPKERFPEPNWQLKWHLTQQHGSDSLITGNRIVKLLWLLKRTEACCQTHCHCRLVVRMLPLQQVIYHVNYHTAGWSDDDLKGLVRGDSLSESLVSLCPQSDVLRPRVTFKRSSSWLKAWWVS